MKKNTIKKIFVLFFVIITITSVFTLDVSAKTCPLCGNEISESLLLTKHNGKTITNPIVLLAFNMDCQIYGANLYSDNENVIGSTVNVLRFDPQSSTYSTMWNKAKKYYDILIPIGFMLMLVYWVIEIFEKAKKESLSYDELLKDGIKLILGVLLLLNGFEIITDIFAYATGVFDEIMKINPTTPPSNGACTFAELADGQYGLFPVPELLLRILPYLIVQISKIMIALTCWSRVLEVVVRSVFTPIGISDIITGGMHSNGMRYLKRFLACGLQGAVTIGILKSYALLSQSIGQNNGGWLQVTVLAITLVTLSTKSKDFANSIIGV